MHERSMVGSHRIAPALLIPPSSPGVGELTDAATVVQLIDQANHPPFLARSAGEEGGARGEGEGVSPPPFLVHSVGEEGGQGGR